MGLEISYYKLNPNNSVLPVLVTTVIFSSILASGSPSVASSDAYDSGRDHGCDDADISDPADRYINQPGKGPSFHTNAFIDGYNTGFNACSSNNDGNNGSSNNNDNNDLPYCNQIGPDYRGSCFDSQDYDEETGLAPCKDGSQVQNYKDCPDRQDKR